MQVTKGTWRMREQCVPGSLSSSPAQEPGNEATALNALLEVHAYQVLFNVCFLRFGNFQSAGV